MAKTKRVRTKPRPKAKETRPARSLKGRITEKIGASITRLGKDGRPAREIAALVSKEHRLAPPLSHVAVLKFMERSASLSTPLASIEPVKDEGLTAGELLKREALKLAEVAGRFAQAGNAQAYLRSLGTLATVLKTTEALASAERKREGTKTGLADVMSAAYAKDKELRADAPETWLTVAVPRVLADLLEVADALATVSTSRRAALGRPLVAALDALAAASSA